MLWGNLRNRNHPYNDDTKHTNQHQCLKIHCCHFYQIALPHQDQPYVFFYFYIIAQLISSTNALGQISLTPYPPMSYKILFSMTLNSSYFSLQFESFPNTGVSSDFEDNSGSNLSFKYF